MPLGGTLEIRIEPPRATEQLVIVGQTPLARALAALGSALGRYVVVVEPNVTADDFPTADRVTGDLAEVNVDERTSIVIAARGDADEDSVEAALATPAWYVGLVASPTRASAIRGTLKRRGVSDETLQRLSSPAGLNIGARTDEEVALTIFAQMLSHRHARESMASLPDTHRNFEPMATPAEAVDPICGMVVEITPAAIRAEYMGTAYYFCGETCLRRFLKNPGAAVAALPARASRSR